MKLRLMSVCAISLVAAACSDEPVNYSAPVGINLKAKSDDTQNGTVTTDKGINTESGNPYGAFISTAERQLGRAPGRIEVDGVELLLGGNSSGVATLGEVFTGEAELLFQMNDTNNSYSVAKRTIAATDNSGPLGFDATFTSADVSDVDYGKLLGGSFKVILRGPAATGFETKGADADLQATFTFAAYD